MAAVNFAIVNRVLSVNGQQLAVQFNPVGNLTLAVFDPDDVDNIPANQIWTRIPNVDTAVIPQPDPARRAVPTVAGLIVAAFVAAIVPGAGALPQLWAFTAPGVQGTLIQEVGGDDRVWGADNPALGSQVTLGPNNNVFSQKWRLVPLP